MKGSKVLTFCVITLACLLMVLLLLTPYTPASANRLNGLKRFYNNVVVTFDSGEDVVCALPDPPVLPTVGEAQRLEIYWAMLYRYNQKHQKGKISKFDSRHLPGWTLDDKIVDELAADTSLPDDKSQTLSVSSLEFSSALCADQYGVVVIPDALVGKKVSKVKPGELFLKVKNPPPGCRYRGITMDGTLVKL